MVCLLSAYKLRCFFVWWFVFSCLLFSNFLPCLSVRGGKRETSERALRRASGERERKRESFDEKQQPAFYFVFLYPPRALHYSAAAA